MIYNVIDLKLSGRFNLLEPYRWRKPMVAYKHVEDAWAEAFRTGTSIQIGTFESYRAGENDRADSHEGIAVNLSGQRNTVWLARAGNPHARKLMEMLAGADWNEWLPQNAIWAQNSFTFEVPPSYIFCASLEPDFSRVALGERVFKITDLFEFARRLAISHPDILQGFEIAPVEYTSREVVAVEQGLIEANPFKKSERFSFEREVRVVFVPGLLPSDKLSLSSPSVSDLIIEIFPGGISGAEKSSGQREDW